MKLALKYLGQGRFVCATRADVASADRLQLQGVYWHDVAEPRSLRQNAFIHAVFDEAWLNQKNERWENAAHLKAAALCAVGHCDIIEWDKAQIADLDVFIDTIAALCARVRGEDTYPILADTGSHLQIRVARPWRFSRLKHEDATKIMDPILLWLCSDAGPCPGTDPSELLKAAKGEAA